MEIKGHFVKTIYYRNDNGYIVALFLCDADYGNDEVIVTGYMGEIDKEKKYSLSGDYVDHPKYGIQFKIDSYKKIIATDEEGLVRYFSSEAFVGIGRIYARAIVNELGLDAINRIKADNDILDTVPKMNKKRKEAILEGLKKDVDDDVIFLTSHHLSLKNILKLKNKYHDDLLKELLDNPYQVIKDVSGIGFHTIDKFALSVGVEESNVQRLIAYSEELLMGQCMRNGDSFITTNEFDAVLSKQLKEYDVSVDEIIDGMMLNRSVVIEQDRVYPVSQYDAECYISRFLVNFPFERLEEIDDDLLEKSISDFEDSIGIQYQDKQMQAIKTFFKKDMLILTGGPGTGKTTIVRAMMELANQVYMQHSVQLIAPTGRAAKRLSELTGYEAKTIHDGKTIQIKLPLDLELLQYDEDKNVIGRINSDDFVTRYSDVLQNQIGQLEIEIKQ